MANRLSAPNQFETLTTALASNLDQNFTQNQAAWNDSSLGFVNGILTDAGSANNYSVTLPYGSPTAYNPGMTVAFLPANTNTGVSTMTVSPLGALAIQTPAGNALLGGEIAQNRACLLTVNAAGTAFLIVGFCPAIGNFGSSGANVTLECAGCTSVVANVSFTANSLHVTLSHLAHGVPVTISIANNSGGSGIFSVNASTASGAAYSAVYVVTAGGIGGVANILTGVGSITIGNTLNRIMTGQSVGLSLYLT